MHRVTCAALFDAEIEPHNRRFVAAAGVRPGERVLDVGCGTGQSSREAARAAVGGSVLGVDVSAPMLELARRLSDEEGVDNVRYLVADAQTHRFRPASFDASISRFGTMFFPDPPAALANIASALRPGGRLTLLVWQSYEANEWGPAIDDALAPGTPPPPPEGGPFSLGDPDATERLLAGAGFDGIAFEDVHEPVCYGPDPATARTFVLGLSRPREALAALPPPEAKRALQRLDATLQAHHTDHGVLLDSRAWVVTARRA